MGKNITEKIMVAKKAAKRSQPAGLKRFKGKRRAGRTANKKAGLSFTVNHMRRMLRPKKREARTRIARCAKTTAVYATGVLEYISAEILELAGNNAKSGKVKHLLRPKDIANAIRGDEELATLMGTVTVSRGGFAQHIEEVLLKKSKK